MVSFHGEKKSEFDVAKVEGSEIKGRTKEPGRRPSKAQLSTADGAKRMVSEVLFSISSLLVQYPERCGEMAEGPGP
ncbi:hypothetical protein NQZ68_023792 [Dissostichus eleginoides]|nr:hypothetical protein NQZ68_023792 [Dissostichus eleginoides]